MADPYSNPRKAIDQFIGEQGSQGADYEKQALRAQAKLSHELNPEGTQPTATDTWAFGEFLTSKINSANWESPLLVGGADSAYYVAMSPDQRITQSASESMQWLSELYGSDVSPWLEAALIADPQDRAEAEARLRAIAAGGSGLVEGVDYVWKEVPVGRGGVQRIKVDPNTGQELPETSIGWTSTISGSELTHRLAAQTAFLATRKDRWGVGPGGTDAVVSSYDYGSVLSTGEMQEVQNAIGSGTTDRGLAGDIVADLTPFGPSGSFSGSFVKVEAGSSVYELNEDWAKAHPTRALAVTKMIQEQQPGATVRIGGQGFVHPVFEMVGRPIDFASAPIALLYKYGARGWGELGEAAQGFNDRKLYADTAKKLEDDLANGLIPPEDVADTIRDIERFKDYGTEFNFMNEGESLTEDLTTTFMPENAGMGLATMSAEGIGLMPGDAAYQPWVAGVGLIHNFSALDPLGWLGAVKNAKGLAEIYTVGKISGETSDVAKAASLASGVATGKTVASQLAGTKFVMLSARAADASDEVNAARHAQMLNTAKKFAARKGYEVVQTTQADGSNGILILGMSGEEGLNLARGYGIEDFRTADGIVHASDRTITPYRIDNVDDALKIGDEGVDVIHLPGQAAPIKFDVPDPNVRVFMKPPKVSENWLVQRLFQQFAKTPDELLNTDYALHSADAIFGTVKRMRDMAIAEAKAQGITDAAQLAEIGTNRVIGLMAQWSPNWDPTVMRALAGAQNKADVWHVLQQGMLGGLRDPMYYDTLLTRMADTGGELTKIEAKLDEYDQLAGKIAEMARRMRVEDLSEASARVVQHLRDSDPEFAKQLDRFNALKSQVKGLDARRVELIGERLHIKSILDMDELTLPIRQVPPKEMLKQLRRFDPTERTKLENFLIALSDYPGGTTGKGLLQAARGEAKFEKRAKEIFFRFGHLKQMMSGGREIHMPLPGHGTPEGQLADYTARSLATIRDHAKLFGLADKDVEELLAAYVNIRNREDWYQFTKKLYEDIANKSPLLDATSRRTLADGWADLVSERGGSFLQKEDNLGFLEREHTLSRDLVDPRTGQKVKSGMPAFSGDFLNTVRLPSNEILMEHLSVMRRWNKGLYARGGVARIGAEAIMGLRDVVNASTYIWKSAVLMGRMPFALLSRIQGEQAWRMAALDYASEVNHPLEWLRSVLHKGDYGIFSDTHAEFLGVLTDNYNEVHSFGKSVKVWRRGNTTLQVADGDRYWNGLSVLYLRRFRSPEVKILLSDKPIAEIIADLERDPIGAGVLDNIDNSAFSREEAIARMRDELKLMTGDDPELYDVLKAGSHRAESPASVELRDRINARPGHNLQDEDGVDVFEKWAGDERLLGQMEDQIRAPQDVIEGQNLERTRIDQDTWRIKDNDSGQITFMKVDDEGNILGYRTLDTDGESAVYVVPSARGQGVNDSLFDALAKELNWESMDDMNRWIDKQMFSPSGRAAAHKQATRYALAKGWIDKGDSLKVGTREFGQYLKQKYEAGDWVPPQFVGAKAAEYITDDARNLAGRFRDFMFHNFYSKPDVYLSRGPMFRQAAVREYRRLLSLGYDEKRAKAAAQAWAAEQTAGWMYDLAARTSAQYFMRNAMPFFPAWQELGGVWLKKLPMRAGGGGFEGWAMGSALYAHRAQALGDFFKATGLVYDDPVTGELMFKIPGLDQAYRWLTGEDEGQVRFRVSGITGMLPIPGQESFLPGLGPLPSSLLGLLSRHNDTIYSLANHVLPYGNDVQVGPTSINHLFHAAGLVPPWELMTRDTQELMMTLSLEDAIRSVHADMPPAPRLEDFATEDEYRAAAKAWSEELINRAEQRSSVHYLIRAASATLSPVSPVLTNKYQEEMGKIWKFISAYEEGGGDAPTSELIDAFKRRYPEAVWYTNSKTINLGDKRLTRNSDDFDDFIKAYRAKKIEVMTPEQFIEWNLGMTQYWVLLGQNRKEVEGKSASEILTSGFQRKEQKSDNYAEWQMYLDTHPEFNKLFEDWQGGLKDENTISMTLQQQYILDTKRQLESLDHLFTVNGVRDGDYTKIVAQLNESLDYAARQTDDPVMQDVNKWWDEVGSPAYEAMSDLYDQAFSLPKPEQGPIFEQLRQLKNSWDHVVYHGETMPTPEEVSWGNKSPQEQALKRLEWVGHPIEWLSRFERQTTGIGGDEKVDDFMTMINQKDQELTTWAADNFISTSSTEYINRKNQIEEELSQYAYDNGLWKYWQLHSEPTYKKIYDLKLYNNNPTYEYIVKEADTAIYNIRAAGYVPSSSSEFARRLQVTFFDKVEQARASDPAFDKFMGQLEVAYAAAGRDTAPSYEMYFKVFFDYYGPTPTLPTSLTGGS